MKELKRLIVEQAVKSGNDVKYLYDNFSAMIHQQEKEKNRDCAGMLDHSAVQNVAQEEDRESLLMKVI